MSMKAVRVSSVAALSSPQVITSYRLAAAPLVGKTRDSESLIQEPPTRAFLRGASIVVPRRIDGPKNRDSRWRKRSDSIASLSVMSPTLSRLGTTGPDSATNVQTRS
jgi:hypothetical protein